MGARLAQILAWFNRVVADPLIARVAPGVTASRKATLRLAILAILGVVLAAIVGGAGTGAWFAFTSSGSVTIVVASVSGDRSGAWQRRVVEALREQLGPRVDVVEVPDLLPNTEDVTTADAEFALDAEGQRIIQRTGGNVLLWGQQSRSGKSAELFLLTWDGTTSTSKEHRYSLKPGVHIPSSLSGDIDTVVAAIALRYARPRKGQSPGTSVYSQLHARLQRLLKARGLQGEARGEVFRAYSMYMRPQGKVTGRAFYKQVVETEREALKNLSPVTTPFDWSDVRASMASTLGNIGNEEGPTYTQEALATRQQVISFYAQNAAPLDWAVSELALGDVYASLGYDLDDAGDEHSAIDAYNQALTQLTRARDPLDWATLEMDLAFAWRVIGHLNNDQGAGQNAVDAARLALQVATRERDKYEWAADERELAIDLRTVADVTGDTKMLQDSIDAYMDVGKVYTRNEIPQGWAQLQLDLGNSWSDLGDLKKDASYYDKAIAAYQAALSEQTEAEEPSERALSLHNLGLTLEHLGELKKDPATLKTALEDLKQSLAIDTRYGFTGAIGENNRDIQTTETALAAMKP